MKISTVSAVFFSATDTTKQVVTAIAAELAKALHVKMEVLDFTLPKARETPLCFAADTLAVFGTPVYAGRVPNVLLQYLASVKGNGAAAVPITVYGNRNFDDALIELRDILEKGGLHTIAAAAFVGEHSFSRILAKGRPDAADLTVAAAFAHRVAEKIQALDTCDSAEPVDVPGTPYPYRGYYQPRDRKGNPVDIRKVKPLTNDNCDNCGICAALCPMGSISPENVWDYTGICIKCGACIKKCPKQAKYYKDAGYLYHQQELEEGLTSRAEPMLFL